MALLAALGLLQACSAVKLGYTHADDLAYWWLDGYFDFTDAQGPRVREDLVRLHRWHRDTELPRLARLFDDAERLAAGDVTAQQACAVVANVRERIDALTLQAEPAAVTLALDLTAEQLTHLQRKYAANNAEYRKEWIAPAATELRGKRLKQVVDRAETIYGKLEEPQLAALRAQIDANPVDSQLILAERIRRQEDAVQTLRRLATVPMPLTQARALLHAYLERVNESPNPAYRAYQNELIAQGCRSFAAVHNSTTPAQRDSAVRRLRAYARDMRELAAQK